MPDGPRLARGRRLRIMFADEARFGRMNRPRGAGPRSRHKTRGRRPVDPRVCLSVRGGVTPGWGLRLSDPAGTRHRMLPDISQRCGQTIYSKDLILLFAPTVFP